MTSIFENIIHPTHHHHKYDFIGDVHGYADELVLLLKKLGYKEVKGVWSHTEYKAVFVGDFINRGPKNRQVIEIIRKMVKKGTGYAILGNHEINAILYFTRRNNGKPIRMPGSANKRFLDKIRYEYKDDPVTFDKRIRWLRKLPLYYDFGKVRAVHAYWNDQHIELLNGALSEGKLTRKFLKDTSRGYGSVSKALLQTTRGVEFCFPPNMTVKDISRNRKITFRVKWWVDPEGSTFESLKYESKSHLPDIPIPEHLIIPYDIYPESAPPVFIGHYCMFDGDMIPTRNICCVDACVANGGKLAAYRWQGEHHLTKDHFVFVDKVTN